MRTRPRCVVEHATVNMSTVTISTSMSRNVENKLCLARAFRLTGLRLTGRHEKNNKIYRGRCPLSGKLMNDMQEEVRCPDN